MINTSFTVLCKCKHMVSMDGGSRAGNLPQNWSGGVM